MSEPDPAAEGSPSVRPTAGSASGTGDRPTVSDGPPDRGRSGGTGAGAAAPGAADATDFGSAVAALTADDLVPTQRRHLLGRVVSATRARGFGDLFKPRAAVRWMTDAVSDIAPHIPIRDRATLHRHFPSLDDEALAERLVRNAARATAGIGAAGGGVAAVEWTVAPTLLSAPVLLAAETIAVVAIELKLIGELHEVYRVALPTGATARTVALIHSWASQRGINPMMPGAGVGAVLGTAARRELRDTLLKRFGRNLTTLGPFLTGAAVASYLNRRATRALGDQLREDLRKKPRAAIEAAPRIGP